MIKHCVLAVVLLASGFFAGWWSNSYFSSSPNNTQTIATPVSKTLPNTPKQDHLVPKNKAVTKPPSKAESVEFFVYQFKQLLDQEAFEQAMSLFDEAGSIDENIAEQLKKIIHKQLLYYLQNNLSEALMTLIDLYLSRYYDDTNVLMILAEYQRLQGYPDEAARVFQLALTYAYSPAQKQQINNAFQRLIKKTDDNFSQQGRWVELLGFYQVLDSINLIQPVNQLRQAQLYQMNGDNHSAQEILTALLDNSRWKAKAQELLALIDSDTPKFDNELASATNIPLQRHGNHYLVNVKLNQGSDIVLMIDTGASITSLSEKAFERLSGRQYFSRIGARLFNTANGIARGKVYRAEQLALGQYQLADIDLAVLDFNDQSGVDGLLGMNVLQHFKFQIDQDQSTLNLQPRTPVK